MGNEFTAIFVQGGEWPAADCPDIPGANGQGKSEDKARDHLAEAMAAPGKGRHGVRPGLHPGGRLALTRKERREEGLRGVPPEVVRETVIVS